MKHLNTTTRIWRSCGRQASLGQSDLSISNPLIFLGPIVAGDKNGQATANMNASNTYKALADFQNAIQHMEEAKRLYAAVYGAGHGYIQWAQGQVNQLQQQAAAGGS